jgi:dipeptidase E
MAERRIVAVGGGDVFALWNRVLDLVKPSPRVLWVGTASAENLEYTLSVYDELRDRADVRRADFFPWPPENLRELVLSQDVIVVGGGNTANMLAIWRVHGFDELLREAWEQGTVLTGSSAGMICWFEAGVTDSFGPQLEGMRDGLGFLPGSACPHYDAEELRRPVYRHLVADGFPAGYAADDDAALLFVGTEPAEVWTLRDGATAYRVEPDSEMRLDARLVSAAAAL